MSTPPIIAVAQATVAAHPVYDAITDLTSLRIFMEHHVCAVQDFMHLAARLARDVAGVAVPWPGPQVPAHLVHDVLQMFAGEASDVTWDGNPERRASHFATYVRAMRAVGADPGARPWPGVRHHDHTLDVATNGSLPQVVGAFAWGREHLIPDMFRRLVDRLGQYPEAAEWIWYLDRHIVVDGGAHGDVADDLLRYLCPDPSTELVAIASGTRALAERHQLWDDTLAAIHQAHRRLHA